MLKYEIYWHLKAFASSHVKCCLNQREAYTYSGLQAGTVFGCLHLAVLDINRPCTCMEYISGWKVLSLYFISLSQPNCSLHLSQKFGQYYPYTRYSPMKSWTAAPGIIMATGTLKCSFFYFSLFRIMWILLHSSFFSFTSSSFFNHLLYLQVLKYIYIDPSIPRSDSHETSPYNIPTVSSR